MRKVLHAASNAGAIALRARRRDQPMGASKSFAGHVACLQLPWFGQPKFAPEFSSAMLTKVGVEKTVAHQLWRKKEARGWPGAQRCAPILSGNKNTRGWPRQKASTSKSGRAAVLMPASV
jgi:hypothetical protein